MGVNEKILLLFLHSIVYANIQNYIGATTVESVRSLPTTGTKLYISKTFEKPKFLSVETSSVINTPRSGIGQEWNYKFYGYQNGTWTLMGTLKDKDGASSYVAGTDLAADGQRHDIKIIVEEIAGAHPSVSAGDSITIHHSEADPFTFYLQTFSWAGSYTTQTYYLGAHNLDNVPDADHTLFYDQGLQYIAYTPTRDGTLDYPYLTITDAWTDNGYTFLGKYFVILDSSKYDEEIVWDGAASGKLYSADGCAPTIYKDVGCYLREGASFLWHNGNSCFYNADYTGGSSDGTYGAPYTTVNNADLNRGTKNVIYGGESAIDLAVNNLTSGISISNYIWSSLPGIRPILKLDSLVYIVLGDAGELHFLNIDSVGITSRCIEVVDTGDVYNCNVYRAQGQNVVISASSEEIAPDIRYNKIYNSNGQGIYINSNNYKADPYIRNNFIYDNAEEGIYYNNQSGTITISNDWIDNVIYNNGLFAIRLKGSGSPLSLTFSITFEHNLIYKHTGSDGGGFFVDFGGGATYTDGSYKDYNIFLDNYTNFKTLNANYVVRNSLYYDYTVNKNESGGTITLTTCTDDDPILCNLDDPFHYGVDVLSPVYKGDTSDLSDYGPRNYIIKGATSETAIDDYGIFNGIIFDGRNFCTNCADLKNYTYYHFKYCTFKNSVSGAIVSSYSIGTIEAIRLDNIKIYDCGGGIFSDETYNNFNYTAIFNCSKTGIYTPVKLNLNHVTITGNGTRGLYLETAAGGSDIKNTIIAYNGDYEIDGTSYVSPTYSCYKGSLSDGVNFSHPTNIKNQNPFFIDSVSEGEDKNLYLMSFAAGSAVNSVCLNGGDDGEDMGAFIVDRTVTSDAWRRHELSHNARSFDWERIKKGYQEFENLKAVFSSYIKDLRRRFLLQWTSDQGLDDDSTWVIIDYLFSLSESDTRLEDETIIRFLPLPTASILTGTEAEIDITTGKITKTGAFKFGKYKGWQVSLIGVSHEEEADVIGAGQIQVPGAGWIVNQWAGWEVYFEKMYYVIASNTSDTLTVYDPYSYLPSVTDADLEICKHVKCIKSEPDYLYLDLDELPDLTGLDYSSFDYRINFPNVKVRQELFHMDQGSTHYKWDEEGWKNNFSLLLEEV